MLTYEVHSVSWLKFHNYFYFLFEDIIINTMPAARKISEQQMQIMVRFMEEHRALAKGQAIHTPQAKAAVRRLWNELAALLNGQGRGTTKTGAQWRDYWRDTKYRVRKKAGEKEVKSSRRRRKTGEDPPSSVELSPLEERIYALMGNKTVLKDDFVRILVDLDEVPQPSPPSPATEIEPYTLPSDDPLSPISASPAHLQPSTSRAPPVQKSPSAAAAAALPDSPAPPPAKRRKASGKSTPVEIAQPRWAWEAGRQHRLAVDERWLKVEERQLAIEERAMAVQERIAAALETVACELVIIRADTAAIRERLQR